MIDYLESLERLAMPDDLHIKECKKLGIGSTEDYDLLKQALLELKSIKEANISEALKCLESIKDALWDDDFHYQRHSKLLDTIEQALLKAQEQEKEKLLFKNIYNTKVKTPLVSIFKGLSQDERFKFIEHIYYHWEEMKEALENKNNELEKENAKLKKKTEALEIIKEKPFESADCINYLTINKNNSKMLDYKYYCMTIRESDRVNEDEFDTFKEVLK